MTELVARPVLELLFPELSWVRQPLAGETAAHRWVFEKLGFAGGYGVELGLLIDVATDIGVGRAGPGRPGRADPPQPAPARAAPAGGRRAARRARAGPAVDAAAPPEPVSRTVVVSNRGPLTFRSAPGGGLVPVPAGGGLASSLHALLAGSGTTWASVTMGAADREAVAQGRMHEDGLDLVPVVVDDDTYRQAYDVVANTTLWYCYHHLWDLPHRPRFDRHWRAAWAGYRAYNRAMADAVAERADDGGAVFVQDYHFSLLGRMLAERRPDLRTVHFLHTPFADAAMFGVLPDDVAAELLDGMAGYGACGFHCHQWETGLRRLLRGGGACGAADVRGAARARPRRASRRRRRRPASAAAGDALRVGGGRPADDRALGPHGTLEEHRPAGCSPSRSS